MNKAKDIRLVAHVNNEIHQLLLRAAELSGSSITQFLVDAAVAKAREVTEQSTRIKLTFEEAENMLTVLDEPPSPPAKLLATAKAYKEKSIHDFNFSDHPQGT